jgi:hypothetical protein
MAEFSMARLEEIGELDDGRCPYRPIRHHFGITSFGITSWTGHRAGDRIINEHDESDDPDGEECYLVHRGRAWFEIGGEAVDAPAGTFVLVPPGVTRTAFAEEAGTTVIALGGTPGKAYRPTGWELFAPVNPLYEAGRYAEAADRGQEFADAGYPVPLYNLACCESLAGRTDDAIRHLGQAIELWEEMREFAAGDSDFDPIRDEPAFKQLVGPA